LSWRISAAPEGWRQSAYRVDVDRDGSRRSYEIESPEQVLVAWPGDPLDSRDIVTVAIAVRGEDGTWSDASGTTTLETGLLDPDDWVARPIGATRNENPHSDERRPSLVRTTFVVGAGLVHARLYATAHGVYEAEVNGTRVGNDALSPGWTVYGARLRYYTYDVTAALSPGANTIGAWLGDGWYRGRLGWRGGFRNVYGTDQSFLGQLELTYADGSREVVATDGTWRSAPSPIIASGLYDGEDYDAREEQQGWSSPRFDDSAWEGVQERHRDTATLVAPTAPPVRATQELRPIEVLTGPSGSRILDFGQNLVGRVRIRVSGEAGTTVTLRTRSCRTARSTPAPCARRARPTTTRSPAETSRSGSRGSRSTGSATSR